VRASGMSRNRGLAPEPDVIRLVQVDRNKRIDRLAASVLTGSRPVREWSSRTPIRVRHCSRGP
jgi:hypothetical protein